MDYETILKSINEVNERIEYEYNLWNRTNDEHTIEECIMIIKGLEIRLNNLYMLAKKNRVPCEEIVSAQV